MKRTLKTAILGAAIAAAATLGGIGQTQAGGLGFFLDSNGNGGVYLGLGGGHHGHWGGYGGYHGSACSHSKALGKAASMGIYGRWIESVSMTRVTVRGKKSGHHVKLVLRRHSPSCSVKSFDYV